MSLALFGTRITRYCVIVLWMNKAPCHKLRARSIATTALSCEAVRQAMLSILGLVLVSFVYNAHPRYPSVRSADLSNIL